MVAQAKKKPPDTIGFRFTVEDRKLVTELQRKLRAERDERMGFEPITVSDVIRLGIRFLAKEKGVTA